MRFMVGDPTRALCLEALEPQWEGERTECSLVVVTGSVPPPAE